MKAEQYIASIRRRVSAEMHNDHFTVENIELDHQDGTTYGYVTGYMRIIPEGLNRDLNPVDVPLLASFRLDDEHLEDAPEQTHYVHATYVDHDTAEGLVLSRQDGSALSRDAYNVVFNEMVGYAERFFDENRPQLAMTFTAVSG